MVDADLVDADLVDAKVPVGRARDNGLRRAAASAPRALHDGPARAGWGGCAPPATAQCVTMVDRAGVGDAERTN